MLEWTVVGVLACALFSLLHGCHARGDKNTYLVIYRSESVDVVQRLRWVVEDLNQEIQKTGNFSSCSGNVTLCVKSIQCVEPEGDDCSVLVYKHDHQYDGLKVHPLDANSVQHPDNNTRSPPQGNARDKQEGTDKPSAAQVWGFGILSVGIISLSGLFGVIFWPLMKTDFYAQMMWILIGLAVGSLTASATFQLIPEGFRLKEHDPEYLNTALFMWSSFWVLYMFESLAKIFFQPAPESETVDTNQMSLKSRRKEEQNQVEVEESGLLPGTAVGNGSQLANKNIPLYMSQSSLHSLSFQKSSHLHSHSKGGSENKTATVAWMIIIGDGIHNFIDGMSIGAGFSNSLAVGTSISIAIACEEFPHELGDFAILINSGMSVKRALLYNFLSACTAFAGLVLGILLGEIDASVYIFAFAGGLFLYIALTDLMPELSEMLATGLKRSKKYALFVLLLQNLGIFIGVTILYLVTRLPININ